MKSTIGLNLNANLDSPNKSILKPGEMGATIELVLSDTKTGEITKRIGPKRSESFLKQFLQLLYVSMNLVPEDEEMAILDIGNTSRNVYATTFEFNCIAGVTVVTNGIIIGTGNTAPTITDYKIETLIPHATMNYGAVTFGAPASDTTTSQITITRNFSNVSGGNVTVNEVALYCEASDDAVRNFCIIRDVIAGGLVVPNGQTLTVNYRPQAII